MPARRIFAWGLAFLTPQDTGPAAKLRNQGTLCESLTSSPGSSWLLIVNSPPQIQSDSFLCPLDYSKFL